MSELVVALAAVAAALAVAGGFKIVSPASTAGALRAMGLPSGIGLVRALGGAEVVAGGAAVVVDHPLPAALVAAAYLGFAVFVAAALRRGTYLQTCGCFGGLEVPPTAVHLVTNVVAAAVAGAATVTGTPTLLSEGDLDGIERAILVGAGATATFLLISVLTALPMATAAARRVS